MIVVDSSVWIDFLNGRNASHVRRLRTILGTDEVVDNARLSDTSLVTGFATVIVCPRTSDSRRRRIEPRMKFAPLFVRPIA